MVGEELGERMREGKEQQQEEKYLQLHRRRSPQAYCGKPMGAVSVFAYQNLSDTTEIRLKGK